MNSASAAPSAPADRLTADRFSAGRSLAGRFIVAFSGSLLVAICAHIAVPLWFTPVPVTLQTFAVLLLGLILGPATAAASLVLYLIEGMAGLPVFAPVGTIAFLHIFGPTGGYLFSYPAAAALTGWLRRRIGSGGFTPSLVAAAAASVLVLLSGAAWFSILTHQSAITVFALTVAPFLPGDILKVIAAAGAATGLRRLRAQNANR